MYDNLVKRLRYRAKREDDYYEHGGDIINEAADAIEALNDTSQAQDKALKNIAGQLARRWIPVTERLPEDRSDVLAYLKYAVGGRIAAANYDKGTWQDCVMGGLYRTEEGVVTHWMPIPEPPEEEAK